MSAKLTTLTRGQAAELDSFGIVPEPGIKGHSTFALEEADLIADFIRRHHVTRSSVARHYGVSPKIIDKIINREMGGHRHRHPSLTRRQIGEIETMLREGHKVSEIARRLGRSYSTVYEYKIKPGRHGQKGLR